jgi:hypothetical protein
MTTAVLERVEGDPKADEPLTYRESLFVASYALHGGNGTETMRRLGFGGANPDVAAAKYMARPRVQRAIQERIRAAEKAQEVTIARIEAEYAKLAFASHEGPLLASHKLGALDSLAKSKGMFKPEQATVVPVTFQFIGGPPLAVDDGSQPAMVIDAPPPAARLDSVDKPMPKGR